MEDRSLGAVGFDGGGFLSSRIREAGGESRRLLHGRGGTFSGWEEVAVDWFDPVLLITLYGEWDGVEKLMGEVPVEIAPVVVLQRRYLAGAPVEVLRGEIPEEVLARESGVSFVLNLRANQNHGFFLDMRPGREWLRQRAEGARVLNLFSYTCAFSVVALAAGAEAVVNVDMAKGALATGRANHRLNFDDATVRTGSFLPHDVFKSWGKLRRLGPFDLIVMDPPSFQKGGFIAAKDYPRAIRQLSGLVTGDGGAKVLACLNAPQLGEDFLVDQFREILPEASYEERLPIHPDFPDAEPERAMKAQVFRL